MENIVSLFPLGVWLAALAFAAIALLVGPKPVTRDRAVERLLQGIALFPIGLQGLWAFAGHVFLPGQTSASIGWESSPFEFEVGVANLGLAVTGFIAVRSGSGFRWAVGLFCLCFTGGAAVGHVVQIMGTGNLAPGNAGVILYTDVLTPVAFLTLLRIQQRLGQA